MGQRMMEPCSRKEDRRTLVDLLSFVFGFGSWVAMTGLWMEMPLMVQRLPEGPALASLLSLALQSANVGCLLYALVYKLRPRRSTEDYSIHLQMALGTLSSLLLVFLWDKTVEVAGSRRSVALLSLSFCMSLVDCVSSVSFLPYMSRFKSAYMTPYLSGEGVGGFIPGVMAMAQGMGEARCRQVNVTVGNLTAVESQLQMGEPRFSEEVFLVVLMVIFLSSWAAFALLNFLTVARKEQIPSWKNEKMALESRQNGAAESAPADKFVLPKKIAANQICCEKRHHLELQELTFEDPNVEVTVKSPVKSVPLSELNYKYLMFLQGLASLATFGIFPAIQPYSLIPYGYGAFHWGVTLCGLAYPLACAFAGLVEVRHLPALTVMTVVACFFGIPVFCTALLSPHPPFYGTVGGAIVVVSFWVVFTSLFSYVKTMVTVVLLETRGHSAMFWVGVVTQVGGVVGALIMFVLINLCHGVFTNPDECDF